MVTAAQLVAKVSVQGVTEATTQLQQMGQSVEETQEKAKATQGVFGDFFKSQLVLTGLSTAYNFLKGQVSDTIQLALGQQDTFDLLNSILKSTNDASGMTAVGLQKIAMGFSNMSQFSTQSVEGVEKVLLTFTNLGKNVFPQATQAVLDISKVMGGDLQSASVELGKALNDPVAGLSSLTRIGVTFSQKQKDLIQNYMQHNELAQAQGVILQELNKEFPPLKDQHASMAVQLAILNNQWTNIKTTVGTDVLPILNQLTGFVSSTALPALENFGGWFVNVGKAVAQYFSSFDLTGPVYQFKQLGTAVGNILSPLGKLASNAAASGFFTNLKNAVSQTLVKAIADVSDVIGGVAKGLNALSANKSAQDFVHSLVSGFQSVSGIVGGTLSANFKTFSGIVSGLGKWWQSTMWPAIQSALPGFEHLASVVATNVVPALAQIWSQGQKLMRDVMPPLVKAFETVAPVVVKVGGFLADNLGKALQFIMPFAIQAAQAVEQFGEAIISRVTPFVTQLYNSIKTFLDWIKPYWPAIWTGIKTVLTSVWDTIKGVVQIAWAIVSGIIKVGLDLLSGNWKQVWADIKDMFSGVWDGIKSLAQSVWVLVSAPITNGVNSFKSWWSGAWDDIKKAFTITWDGIKDAASNAWGGITGAIKGGIDDVINAINGFIGLLDKIQIHIPSVGVGPVKTPSFDWGGLNIPKIPLLAMGGLITQGGMAIVGDRGPEGLFLPSGAQVIPNNQLGGMGQPINLNITVDNRMDGMRLAGALMPHIVSQIRTHTGARF